MEGPAVAVILNIKSFGIATLALVGLLVAVTLLHRKPTRRCHHCGRKVPLDRRTCQYCGYDFEPVRLTR
jgi:rRNA maturation endonuclease Nob1